MVRGTRRIRKWKPPPFPKKRRGGSVSYLEESQTCALMGWRWYVRVMGNEPCYDEMGVEQSTGASTHCGERRSDIEELALHSSSNEPHSLAFASSQPAESIHKAIGPETHRIVFPADRRLHSIIGTTLSDGNQTMTANRDIRSSRQWLSMSSKSPLLDSVWCALSISVQAAIFEASTLHWKVE